MNRHARLVIALNLPNAVAGLLAAARAIAEAVSTNHLTFPKPQPTLAQINAAIDALVAAETKVLHRVAGAVSARDRRREELVGLLGQLRSYVYQVAMSQPDQALEIVGQAAMHVRASGTRTKQPLAIKPGPVAGAIVLVARAAGPRASNEWQYSADQKTWQAASSTLQARTTITSLPTGVTLWFRHRAILKDGPREWSPVISSILQ